MATAIVNPKLIGKEKSSVHRFELAGLGKAPFRFTGMAEKTFQACPGAPVVAGSSCDYCGTGIRYEFWCESADKKAFKVGCDCIHKSDDSSLIQQISAAERKLRDAKNKAAKERKEVRKVERITAAKLILPTIRGKLAQQPHPSSHFASEGRTMLDYVNWCIEHGCSDKAAYIIERNA